MSKYRFRGGIRRMGERPSVPGRISKSRTAVISSVPIVSFLMPGGGCAAGSRRIS